MEGQGQWEGICMQHRRDQHGAGSKCFLGKLQQNVEAAAEADFAALMSNEFFTVRSKKLLQLVAASCRCCCCCCFCFCIVYLYCFAQAAAAVAAVAAVAAAAAACCCCYRPSTLASFWVGLLGVARPSPASHEEAAAAAPTPTPSPSASPSLVAL